MLLVCLERDPLYAISVGSFESSVDLAATDTGRGVVPGVLGGVGGGSNGGYNKHYRSLMPAL